MKKQKFLHHKLMNIKKILYFLAAFILMMYGCTAAQTGDPVFSWDNSQTPEWNIARNAIALDSCTQWDFLDEILRGKRVLIIGEQGHADRTTVSVRAHMLHELKELGFETVLFEVAPFIPVSENALLKESISHDQWESTLDLQPCYHMHEFRPAIEMIKNGEITIAGMDILVDDSVVDTIQAILEKNYETSPDFLVDWDRLKELQHKLNPGKSYAFGSMLSFAEEQEYMNTLNQIRNETDRLIRHIGKNRELSAVRQWLRNMDRNYALTHSFSTEVNTISAYFNQTRDRMMAENVMWYVEHFPDEKFVVWCANFHGNKDISQTIYRPDNNCYYLFNLMGEQLYNRLGNELYSMALTSLNQRYPDYYTQEMINYIQAENGGKMAADYPPGELERTIGTVTNDAPFAFVDFERLRDKEGYRDVLFEMSAIYKKHGQWLNMYDGLYYIRDMEAFH